MLNLLRRGWRRIDRWLDDYEVKQPPEGPSFTPQDIDRLFSNLQQRVRSGQVERLTARRKRELQGIGIEVPEVPEGPTSTEKRV